MRKTEQVFMKYCIILCTNLWNCTCSTYLTAMLKLRNSHPQALPIIILDGICLWSLSVYVHRNVVNVTYSFLGHPHSALSDLAIFHSPSFFCFFFTWCSLTFSGNPKLSANNCSISCVPAVITDCAPLSSDADLHSTFTFIPSSSQSDVCVIAGWAYKAHRQINNNSCGLNIVIFHPTLSIYRVSQTAEDEYRSY